jgi:hypothetical protein
MPLVRRRLHLSYVIQTSPERLPFDNYDRASTRSYSLRDQEPELARKVRVHTSVMKLI